MSNYHDMWRSAIGSRAEAWKKYVEAWEKKIGSCLEFKPQGAANEGLTAPGNAAAAPVLVAAQAQSVALSGKAKDAAALVAGMPVAVKNNIASKGFKLSCGSRMLSDVVATYDATAVARLKAAGAVVVASANMDEFGMGSSCDNSALQRTNNPWDPSRVAGGSSGGSAAAVAAGIVPLALGSDTGGSVRQPASFCGVYGLKPTYGVISRFGLVAYASSLEVVGLVARDLETLKAGFAVARGRDEMDQTSLTHPLDSASTGSDTPVRSDTPGADIKTIAVLKNLSGLEPEVLIAYNDTLAALKTAGVKIVEVELPGLEYAVPAYYTIAAAEASANLARYNGIRYGLRPFYAETPEDLITRSRTDGFGPEVKLRVMLGTFVLRSGFQEQYYGRAQKIRTAIRAELEQTFKNADLILTPVFPTRAFPHGDTSMDAFAQKQADKFTVTANLAGIPALSVPAGVHNGLPVGMQFMGPAFAEERLFAAAALMAKTFPVQDCPGASADWSQK